jgi:hypothetical protein
VISRRSLLVALLVIGGCVDRGTRAEEFFGSDMWRTFEAASRLEAFRVVPAKGRVDNREPLTGNVRIVGAPFDPGENWLKLFALVEDPLGYDWSATPPSNPQPEILYRFIEQNGNQADLLISFSDNVMTLVRPGGPGKWVVMSRLRGRHIELAKRIFILDKFIQDLPGDAQSGPLRPNG